MLSSILLIKGWDQNLIFGGQNLGKDRPFKNKKYTKNQNYVNKITDIKYKQNNGYKKGIFFNNFQFNHI